MSQGIASMIAACEADIRAGQPQKVARRLAEINTARVPRAWRLPMANVCRRASLYSLGLALLVRVVHPRRRELSDPATPHEIAEYAVLLLRSGALTESLATLQKVDEKQVSEVMLYRAFAHFSLWEFRDAVPGLERYVMAQISPYAQLVGRVNLAYAYVECGMYDSARYLLDENISLTSEGGHQRLQSNCYSLRAQVHILTGDYVRAKQDLDCAQQILGAPATNDGLFIAKWRLILEGLESGRTEPLYRLKVLAMQNCDWEAAREADFFALKIDFQRPLFRHLLFGTPFLNYRKRIHSELGRYSDLPYFLVGRAGVPTLDLSSGRMDGESEGSGAHLMPGGKCHQLIDVLMRDFYRPVNVGGLFSAMFPGEYFDIFSSPDRVHQILSRTRRWLKEARIPARINITRGFYTLKLQDGVAMRVALERESVDCMTLHFQKLETAVTAGKPFTAKVARQDLGMSRRTLQRLLIWGLERGRIERLGANKVETQYRILARGARAS